MFIINGDYIKSKLLWSLDLLLKILFFVSFSSERWTGTGRLDTLKVSVFSKLTYALNFASISFGVFFNSSNFLLRFFQRFLLITGCYFNPCKINLFYTEPNPDPFTYQIT